MLHSIAVVGSQNQNPFVFVVGGEQVSAEEWKRYVSEGSTDFAEIMSIFTMNENCFAEIDSSGNGQISWDEFEAWIDLQAEKEIDPAAEVRSIIIEEIDR